MNVYALGDLHLEGGQDKPMDVFGERWSNHREKIFANWNALVKEDDCVLLAGDFCWAMQFSAALEEFNAIAKLPGSKILIRGNHDYWWSSPTKMRASIPSCFKLIQNDAVDMGEFVVCGSRGWLMPGASDFGKDDEKIYARELLRLEMSLNVAMQKLKCGEKQKKLIVMLHYPPLYINGEETGFTELIERYPVDEVVYGHLHAQSCALAFEGEKNGVNYTLCSADHLYFTPKLIKEF